MAGGRKKKKEKTSAKSKKRKILEEEENKKDEGDDFSSDDDEFPCAFSPKKKRKDEFETGDLVFAKFRNFPYWPALFYKYDATKRRARVYFFEEATVDNKTTLRVPLTSIRPYTCDEKDKFISNGTTHYDSYRSGLERAHEYLQKRAFSKVPEFFADTDDEDDDDDEDDEIKESDDNNAEKLGNEVAQEELAIEDEKPVQHNTTTSMSIFKLSRKSKRKEKEESKPYMKWIKKFGKEYLYQLTKGVENSERHHLFFNGSQKERDGLKYISGYGPIHCEEESEKLLDILQEWYAKEFDFEDVNPITYLSDVWLPEVIIQSIKSLKNCSFEKAEDIFLNGETTL